jgi:hypothetical protein
MDLLPKLNDIFAPVAQLPTQRRQTYEKLDQLGAPPSREALEEGGPPEIARLRALFRGLLEALQDQLRVVEATGAVVKDIDTGLVDFYFEKDGREVFLCWRYGETEIAYFHEIESGFRGRRALTQEDRERRRVLH